MPLGHPELTPQSLQVLSNESVSLSNSTTLGKSELPIHPGHHICDHTVSTTWRCGTGSRIAVTTCSANSAERFAWQLGQKLRVRQEKASRCSARQSGQRIRAKPPSRRPQAR